MNNVTNDFIFYVYKLDIKNFSRSS